jgi:hypothetical protein
MQPTDYSKADSQASLYPSTVTPTSHLCRTASLPTIPGAVEVVVDLGVLEELALVDRRRHGVARREVVVHAVHLT